jgi:UDP-N-acetylglucosamine acyltransferase
MSGISEMASIHPNATIGEGVQIDAFSSIAADVAIGDGTWIGPNVTIMDGARIGKNCRIFPGAVISAIPQDLKFKGEDSTAEIGDNTTIRECVTVNRGTADRDSTKVGSNCLLMAYVHVAHDTFIGDWCIIANSVNLAGHITIEDHVIIEGNAAVQQFVIIGRHSFIAGATLVRKNVPPFVKAAREPISYIGVNRVGLERRGFTKETIDTIEETYRLIFVHGRNISQGMSQATQEVIDCAERNEIIDFIAKSENGVIRGLN